MSFTAFVLVFISVFLHAGWNFLSKSSRPSAAYYMLMAATSSLFWLTFVFCAGLPWASLPLRFWLLLAGSICCNVPYLISLGLAYRHGDISMVYPLVRSIPVIFTALATIAFGIGRKMPTQSALIGMFLVSIGCFLIPLNRFSSFQWKNYCSRTILFVLIAACAISGYTIFDSGATAIMRDHSASVPGWLVSICYLYCIETCNALGLGVWVLTHKRERVDFLRLVGQSWTPYVAGIFSTVAYVLILIAMKYVDNVSYIQAFRQMSLPVGVLLGILILKESWGAARITGLVLVVSGLVLAAF